MTVPSADLGSLVGSATGIAREIASVLGRRGQMLAVVETSAGGVACGQLSSLPGASSWLLGGFVAYATVTRSSWLGIPAERVREVGAVSAESALDLARAARRTLRADWGAAETGIAGPQNGRRSPKPVGLGYSAVVGVVDGQPFERVVEVQSGLDDRSANQAVFALALITLVRDSLAQADS